MSGLAWDGTAESDSPEKNRRRERGQEKWHFPYSADHERDWQPYPVDPYSAKNDFDVFGSLTLATQYSGIEEVASGHNTRFI